MRGEDRRFKVSPHRLGREPGHQEARKPGDGLWNSNAAPKPRSRKESRLTTIRHGGPCGLQTPMRLVERDLCLLATRTASDGMGFSIFHKFCAADTRPDSNICIKALEHPRRSRTHLCRQSADSIPGDQRSQNRVCLCPSERRLRKSSCSPSRKLSTGCYFGSLTFTLGTFF